MLEPIKKDREFELWPLHITIVPWFPCDDQARLDRTLGAVAAKHSKFIVKTGKSETWGKKEKFDVVLIDDLGQLHRLHRDVFNNLEKNGFPIHQKDFLGAEYKPHVTVRNNLQKESPKLRPSQEITIKNFSLIKQIRLKKTGTMIKAVVKDYDLNEKAQAR